MKRIRMEIVHRFFLLLLLQKQHISKYKDQEWWILSGLKWTEHEIGKYHLQISYILSNDLLAFILQNGFELQVCDVNRGDRDSSSYFASTEAAHYPSYKIQSNTCWIIFFTRKELFGDKVDQQPVLGTPTHSWLDVFRIFHDIPK